MCSISDFRIRFCYPDHSGQPTKDCFSAGKQKGVLSYAMLVNQPGLIESPIVKTIHWIWKQIQEHSYVSETFDSSCPKRWMTSSICFRRLSEGVLYPSTYCCKSVAFNPALRATWVILSSGNSQNTRLMGLSGCTSFLASKKTHTKGPRRSPADEYQNATILFDFAVFLSRYTTGETFAQASSRRTRHGWEALFCHPQTKPFVLL